MASLNFNAHEVDPEAGFEPLPAGKHLCVVTSSEMKPTKNGAGEYLQLELEVIEGAHKGRKLWDRLTLKHPNETTVRIARGTLSALCRAAGVMQPRDSIELHNIPVVVTVGLKERKDTGELANEVKGYGARAGASYGAAQGAQASAQRHDAAAAGSVPPWKR